MTQIRVYVITPLFLDSFFYSQKRFFLELGKYVCVFSFHKSIMKE